MGKPRPPRWEGRVVPHPLPTRRCTFPVSEPPSNPVGPAERGPEIVPLPHLGLSLLSLASPTAARELSKPRTPGPAAAPGPRPPRPPEEPRHPCSPRRPAPLATSQDGAPACPGFPQRCQRSLGGSLWPTPGVPWAPRPSLDASSGQVRGQTRHRIPAVMGTGVLSQGSTVAWKHCSHWPWSPQGQLRWHALPRDTKAERGCAPDNPLSHHARPGNLAGSCPGIPETSTLRFGRCQSTG